MNSTTNYVWLAWSCTDFVHAATATVRLCVQQPCVVRQTVFNQMFTTPASYSLSALFSMMILEPWWGCYIDVLFRPHYYSLNIN